MTSIYDLERLNLKPKPTNGGRVCPPMEKIMTMNITEQWQSNNTVHIAHDDKVVQVTRYYALHGNSRAWAIQCKANIAEYKNLKAAISHCKKEISNHKKYVEPMYGITEYIY